MSDRAEPDLSFGHELCAGHQAQLKPDFRHELMSRTTEKLVQEKHNKVGIIFQMSQSFHGFTKDNVVKHCLILDLSTLNSNYTMLKSFSVI